MTANHILKTTNLQKSFSGIIAAEDINISVKKSEIIAHFGDEEENGGWEPHLHFQLSIVKPETHDLPGVVDSVLQAQITPLK